MQTCSSCHTSDNPDAAESCYKCGGGPLIRNRKRYPGLSDLDLVALTYPSLPSRGAVDRRGATLLTIFALLVLALSLLLIPGLTQPPTAQLCHVQGTDLGMVRPGKVASGTITVGNCGGLPLTWQGQSDDSSRLKLNKSSGIVSHKEADRIPFTVTTRSFDQGPFSAIVKITSNGGSQQAIITLTVVPLPCIRVDLTSLSFVAYERGTDPHSQPFALNNCGDRGTVTTSKHTNDGASWLSADSGGPFSVPGHLVINVSVHTQGMSQGQYTGYVNITLTDASGATTMATVNVKLTIIGPCISVQPTQLFFKTFEMYNPNSQPFVVNNCGDAGIVKTSVTTNWLSTIGEGQMYASGQLVIYVLIYSQNMFPGQYAGYVNVTLTDANGVITTWQVKVYLDIASAPPPE